MNKLLTEAQIIDGLFLEMPRNPCALGSREFALWNQGLLLAAAVAIPQQRLDESHPALVEGVEAGIEWAKGQVEKGAAYA